MSSIGTGYDLYASQFSPDGRVFQVTTTRKFSLDGRGAKGGGGVILFS